MHHSKRVMVKQQMWDKFLTNRSYSYSRVSNYNIKLARICFYLEYINNECLYINVLLAENK